ncbi:MAG TPA: hypothetical protein RMH99_11010, partial [Sandaracinaceae bacterium LLY-WYZ-13_1]|nr:hypothetical protein [Sandaracinaceae bacterium LLY-WYZ-13_1]
MTDSKHARGPRITLGRPGPVPFSHMAPRDDRTRWCARCARPVHDLAAPPEAEARALLSREDAPCVRTRHDAKGR